ncbi:MAG: hypothetical protein EXR77_17390 [Myxococcales bacterium]|nr:hypothetical protein [Myxococcales bacterium]
MQIAGLSVSAAIMGVLSTAEIKNPAAMCLAIMFAVMALWTAVHDPAGRAWWSWRQRRIGGADLQWSAVQVVKMQNGKLQGVISVASRSEKCAFVEEVEFVFSNHLLNSQSKHTHSFGATLCWKTGRNGTY